MDSTEKFRQIRSFILDMDGVLTDGRVLVLENGLQARHMSIRDGYAIQLAVKRGYHIAIISGAESAPVSDRLNRLGVTDVFMAVKDKKQFLLDYCRQRSLSLREILFMGDDMPDLPLAGQVGIFACPSDAVQEIVAVADYLSPVAGGSGCVREVIEKVMKLNDHWTADRTIASS